MNLRAHKETETRTQTEQPTKSIILYPLWQHCELFVIVYFLQTHATSFNFRNDSFSNAIYREPFLRKYYFYALFVVQQQNGKILPCNITRTHCTAQCGTIPSTTVLYDAVALKGTI